MNLRVLLSVRADKEIDAAVAWFAARDREYAERWHVGLTAALATLGREPLRYPLSADLDLEFLGVREMPFGRARNVYRVLYRVEGDSVRVLTIRHVRRGPLDPTDLPV